MIYYSETYQAKAMKAEDILARVWRKAGTKFQESFPRGVTLDMRKSPGNELYNMGEILTAGEARWRLCPGLLLEIDRIDTFCLTHTKILVSQKEIRCSVWAVAFLRMMGTILK